MKLHVPDVPSSDKSLWKDGLSFLKELDALLSFLLKIYKSGEVYRGDVTALESKLSQGTNKIVKIWRLKTDD